MSGISLNLVVIRSADLERSLRFYKALGIDFAPEQHGTGPQHYSCEIGSTVLEIYPLGKQLAAASTVRIGFRVPSLETSLKSLKKIAADIVTAPADSPWGRRAVVRDPDGNLVELTE